MNKLARDNLVSLPTEGMSLRAVTRVAAVDIDTDTKLVPSWYAGGCDGETARVFISISDLAKNLATRVQLTSDGHKP